AKVDVVTNRAYTREISRLRRAIDEITAAGWAAGVALAVVEGPGEYLLGEETGLLEVVDGRPPFPRLAPPYRRGIDEIPEPHRRHDPGSDSAADLELATPTHGTDAPPALVSNVETFANVPGILAHGDDWFRELGTVESPGTIVCTVSGAARRHGVGRCALGRQLGTA